MDLGAHLASGLSVSLGSDIAGGPDISMVRVARAMIETVKHLRLRGHSDRRFPSAASAWWQITAGNAGAIGLQSHGSLRAGAPADLVLMRPTDRAWLTAPHHPDPLAALLYSFDERCIQHTLVLGRIAHSR